MGRKAQQDARKHGTAIASSRPAANTADLSREIQRLLVASQSVIGIGVSEFIAKPRVEPAIRHVGENAADNYEDAAQ